MYSGTCLAVRDRVWCTKLLLDYQFDCTQPKLEWQVSIFFLYCMVQVSHYPLQGWSFLKLTRAHSCGIILSDRRGPLVSVEKVRPCEPALIGRPLNPILLVGSFSTVGPIAFSVLHTYSYMTSRRIPVVYGSTRAFTCITNTHTHVRTRGLHVHGYTWTYSSVLVLVPTRVNKIPTHRYMSMDASAQCASAWMYIIYA